jgi:hypothetical protein
MQFKDAAILLGAGASAEEMALDKVRRGPARARRLYCYGEPPHFFEIKISPAGTFYLPKKKRRTSKTWKSGCKSDIRS